MALTLSAWTPRLRWARGCRDGIGDVGASHIFVFSLSFCQFILVEFTTATLSSIQKNMPAAPKPTTKATKAAGQKYFIDFSGPAADGILDAAGFEKFLHDRIKVDGKPGQLGDVVKVQREGESFCGSCFKYRFNLVEMNYS